MFNLNPGEYWQIALGEGSTTTEPVCSGSWVDYNSNTLLPALGSAVAALNGTTAVEIISSPTESNMRQVQTVGVYNGDTVSHNVVIQVYYGALLTVWEGALEPKESLTVGKGGWVKSGGENYLTTALASGNIWLGNGSGLATSVTMSGDGTISNTGELTVTKTNGVDFGSFATGTDAGNLTGTVGAGQLSGQYTGITGLGTIATGTWNGAVVGVLYGGTGGSTPATARTGLGLAIGTDVQAYDADLFAIASLSGTTGLLKKTAANTWALDTTAYLSGNQTITLSGDVAGSGATGITAVLASSGVTAGTYRSVTVDVKGRVTAGTNPTTLAGYGITDAASLTAANTFLGVPTFSNATYSALFTRGNVGIGITNPQQALDVHSGTNIQMRLGATGGGYYFDVGRNNITGALTIQGNQANYNSICLAPDGGNVVIGALTSIEKLTVAGNIVSSSANSGYIGTAVIPWAGGYTQAAFTVTSGQEFKTNWRYFTDAEKVAAAILVQKCPRLFQLKTSVAEKGTDKARLHAGVLYEEAYSVLQAAGFADADIERFSLFCASPTKKTVTKTREVVRQKTVSKIRKVEEVTTADDGTQTVTYVDESYDDPVWVTDESGADVWFDLTDASGDVLKSADGTVRKYRKPVQVTVDEEVTEMVDDPDATPIRGIRYTELTVWWIIGLLKLNDDRVAEISSLSARVAALEAKGTVS